MKCVPAPIMCARLLEGLPLGESAQHPHDGEGLQFAQGGGGKLVGGISSAVMVCHSLKRQHVILCTTLKIIQQGLQSVPQEGSQVQLYNS